MYIFPVIVVIVANYNYINCNNKADFTQDRKVTIFPFLLTYTTLCDKVCQCLPACLWFSPVSPTNNTDRHDITEI
jgi:hypothetical protein